MQGLMTIYECVPCKHRYGCLTGQLVSACPRCKSDWRTELAADYKPVATLGHEEWMDLWRFGRVAVKRFVEILAAGNAQGVTACPECDIVGFIHRPECPMKQLCDIEGLAISEGLEAGRINYYECDTCSGKIYTIDLHAGVSPMFVTKCRGSIGCGGTMKSGMYRVPPDFDREKVQWMFRRPADVTKFDEDMADRVLQKGQLVLERLTEDLP